MPSSSLPLFYSLRSADPKITPILERLKLIFAQLFSKAIIDGHLLEGVEIQPAIINKIPHKLERFYNGWYIVRVNSQAIFWETATNIRGNEYLYLESTAVVPTTVSIWVF